MLSAYGIRMTRFAGPAGALLALMGGCPHPLPVEPGGSGIESLVEAPASAPGLKDGALQVLSVNPTVGTTDGDRIALVRGAGFVPGMTVMFGDQEAKEVTWVSDSMVTALVPPHQAGPVDVTLQADIDGLPREVALPHSFTFMMPPDDDGTDTDGDGLTDVQEQIIGYQIRVDFLGLGMNPAHLTRYNVNSDPLDPDTDDDGLLDNEEYYANTNPRARDTDTDGLWDGEEAKRWLTSPISVDSDGDARASDPSTDRSTIPPVFDLFDGLELYSASELAKDPSARTLKLTATSPTLDDTDGDGVTDFDEIDTPVRTPLLADMPQLLFEIVDNVDIRLDVEYAEEEGVTTAFETSLATAQSQSTAKSRSNTVSASTTVGAEVGFSVQDGFSASRSVEVTAGYEHSWETTAESAVSAEQTFSQLEEKARTNTEVAATGSMTAGVRITNLGNITVQLIDMVQTVRQWLPNTNPDPNDPTPGTYQTLAALAPDLGPGLTLAPGADSGVLLAEASDLNADRVKEFLRHPDALQVEPAAFELVNDRGINFAFIEEVTQARTARLSIDYGDGTFDEFRIATNVDRNPDSSLRGVSLAQALDLTIGADAWSVDTSTTVCLSTSVISNGGFELPDVPTNNPTLEVPTDWEKLEVGGGRFSLVDITGFPVPEGEQWAQLIANTASQRAALYQQIDGPATEARLFDYSVLSWARFGGANFKVSLWAGDPAAGGLEVDFDALFSRDQVDETWTGTLTAPAEFADQALYLVISVDGTTGPTELFFDAVDAEKSASATLLSIRDRVSDPDRRQFWSIFFTGPGAPSTFSNTRLHAGGTVLLAYQQDADSDGLFASQEQQYGSSDDAADSDGDGISDPEEAARFYAPDVCATPLPGGWTVNVTQRDGATTSYRAYSDPRFVDTDMDNLTDLEERTQGSDPTLRDTDGDGLADDVDPAPTVAARVLHVTTDGDDSNNGLTWGTAYADIATAMSAAAAANDPNDGDLSNDISEIWVAAGEYSLTDASPPDNVALYGGFAGTETRQGQRVIDALGNDTRLVSAALSPVFSILSDTTARIDGFTFDGSTSRAVKYLGTRSQITFANCLFANNTSSQLGGAILFQQSSSTDASTLQLLDCVFSNNHLTGFGGLNWGGAIAFQGQDPDSVLDIRRCTFVNNRIDHGNGARTAGGAVGTLGGSTMLTDCIFRANSVVNAAPAGLGDDAIRGGAVAILEGSRVSIDGCRFENNEIDEAGERRADPWTSLRAGGAIHVGFEAVVDLQNSVFVGNRAAMFGGAIYIQDADTGDAAGKARIVNCSFGRNQVYASGAGAADRVIVPAIASIDAIAIGGAIGSEGEAAVENCAFWDNAGIQNVSTTLDPFGIGAPITIPFFNWGSETQVAVGPEIRSIGGGVFRTGQGALAISNSAINSTGQRFATSDGFEDVFAYSPCNALANFGVNMLTPQAPGFVSMAGGDLRLTSSSPLIDAGETVVDASILQSGFQQLPSLDFDGNDRIADGNGDGDARVDIGAYEFVE